LSTERIENYSRYPVLPDDLPALTHPSNIIKEHPWYLLAAIVDSCQDAIISKDLDGIITSWNPAACRMFGYRAEEMIGQPILKLIPPEMRYEEIDILRRIRAGERIEHYEAVRMAKDGHRLELSLTISPIRDNTGRIVGASKIAHDISDRKRAEEARFRLSAIIDSSEDAIVGKNLDGIVTSWNQAACRMFGYTAEEMVGQSILRIIPEELHPEEAEILRKVRAGEHLAHFETTRLTKSGARLQVSLTISPVRDGSGRVVGTSKIARDISDRKKMEKHLLQSEKLAATGRMAATIAHEINNPLEAVMNLIYLARQTAPESTDTRRFLETAERELDRVSHIARLTLGYYRDRGVPTELYLHTLLDEVLAVHRSKIDNREIRVERQFDESRPIVVNKGEMVQVFSNIIANSVDAMPNGGLLRIQVASSGPNGDTVQVLIQDEGSGIEEKHLARIFEPFFTTKLDVGTGIGLWVSKKLLENRGGRIQVTGSTTPGASGTKVVIDLPYQHSPHIEETSRPVAVGSEK
jgi:PAS domain S-box-containing protein